MPAGPLPGGPLHQTRGHRRTFPSNCPPWPLCLRVRLVVHRDEVGESDLRVLLGGGQARVAQQFLDGAEVGAIGQQVRGVGVAEAVRMN